jgi:putative ABC transport system permease protein
MRSVRVALFMAFKSIARGNIGITLLTIAMLVLVNLNMLFVPSLVNGIVHSANDKVITTYSSNIIVESTDDQPLMGDIRELASQIEKINGVTAVTYRNNLGATLSTDVGGTTDNEHTNCIIRSIPVDRDKRVFDIANSIIEGTYLDPGDSDQILLGVQLAGADRKGIELYASSLKKVHSGDKISVKYANGVKKQYHVKGIFYTEFVQTDLQAYVTDREFKSIYPLTDNRATVINVKIADDNQAQNIIADISRLRNNLKFSTWQDTAGIVLSMTTSFDIIKSILTLVNLLVAGITVFIVTYIDLVNKRRQIGIERAIGITPAAITVSYMLRALFYGLTGTVISYYLFIYVVTPLEASHPFHFPFGNVALFIGRGDIIQSFSVILGVAIFAAFLPVWQTIRIRLLDAIWG